MSHEEKPLRADAERNRRRLLDAAAALFSERGLDVGVAEIAQHAGVGRGTLFRNFPSKEDLVAAIVVDRMSDAAAIGKGLLEAEDPGAALFEFLQEVVGRQQLDRGLFEALGDEFLANPEIRSAYAELLGVVDRLVGRAQEAGQVRADVGSIDVMMMVKGVCQAVSAFAALDPHAGDRQLDLVRAALSNTADAPPLRGRMPTLGDIEQSLPAVAEQRTATPDRAGTPPPAALSP